MAERYDVLNHSNIRSRVENGCTKGSQVRLPILPGSSLPQHRKYPVCFILQLPDGRRGSVRHATTGHTSSIAVQPHPASRSRNSRVPVTAKWKHCLRNYHAKEQVHRSTRSNSFPATVKKTQAKNALEEGPPTKRRTLCAAAPLFSLLLPDGKIRILVSNNTKPLQNQVGHKCARSSLEKSCNLANKTKKR